MKNNREKFVEVTQLYSEPSKSKKLYKKAQGLYLMRSYKIMNVTSQQAIQSYDRLLTKYQQKQLQVNENDWHKNQRKLFIWFLICYCQEKKMTIQDLRDEEWQSMGHIFFEKNLLFLKFQGLSILKNTKRHNWTSDDDQLLKKYVEQIKSNQWNSISKNIFFQQGKQGKGRFISAKQCRQRWFNHLCKEVNKQQWTYQQDTQILKATLEVGKKWSQIARALGTHRTQHMVKNRYNSIINKIRRKKVQQQQSLTKKALAMLQKQNKRKNQSQQKIQQEQQQDNSCQFQSQSKSKTKSKIKSKTDIKMKNKQIQSNKKIQQQEQRKREKLNNQLKQKQKVITILKQENICQTLNKNQKYQQVNQAIKNFPVRRSMSRESAQGEQYNLNDFPEGDFKQFKNLINKRQKGSFCFNNDNDPTQNTQGLQILMTPSIKSISPGIPNPNFAVFDNFFTYRREDGCSVPSPLPQFYNHPMNYLTSLSPGFDAPQFQRFKINKQENKNNMNTSRQITQLICPPTSFQSDLSCQYKLITNKNDNKEQKQ